MFILFFVISHRFLMLGKCRFPSLTHLRKSIFFFETRYHCCDGSSKTNFVGISSQKTGQNVSQSKKYFVPKRLEDLMAREGIPFPPPLHIAASDSIESTTLLVPAKTSLAPDSICTRSDSINKNTKSVKLFLIQRLLRRIRTTKLVNWQFITENYPVLSRGFVFSERQRIVATLVQASGVSEKNTNPVLVVKAGTGDGKSAVLPLIFLDLHWRGVCTALERLQLALGDTDQFNDCSDVYEIPQAFIPNLDAKMSAEELIAALQHVCYCGPIYVSQPTRVAAKSLADFVSKLLTDDGLSRVGYATAADRRVDTGVTEIVYATPGYLLRALCGGDDMDLVTASTSQDLNGGSTSIHFIHKTLRAFTLIIDEAHITDTETAFLLAWARRWMISLQNLYFSENALVDLTMRKRWLLIASATINTEEYSQAFARDGLNSEIVQSLPQSEKNTPHVSVFFADELLEHLQDTALSGGTKLPLSVDDALWEQLALASLNGTPMVLNTAIARVAVRAVKPAQNVLIFVPGFERLSEVLVAIVRATGGTYAHLDRRLDRDIEGERSNLFSEAVEGRVLNNAPAFSFSKGDGIVDVVALHSSVLGEATRQLEGSTGCARIVIATNVAENSITIPDISLVLDTCLETVPAGESRITRLVVRPVSDMSLLQRRGRTGRTCDGVCIHLMKRTQVVDRNASLDKITREMLFIQAKALFDLKNWRHMEHLTHLLHVPKAVLDTDLPFRELCALLLPPLKEPNEFFPCVRQLLSAGVLSHFKPYGVDPWESLETARLTLKGKITASLPLPLQLAIFVYNAMLVNALPEAVVVACAIHANVLSAPVHGLASARGSELINAARTRWKLCGEDDAESGAFGDTWLSFQIMRMWYSKENRSWVAEQTLLSRRRLLKADEYVTMCCTALLRILYKVWGGRSDTAGNSHMTSRVLVAELNELRAISIRGLAGNISSSRTPRHSSVLHRWSSPVGAETRRLKNALQFSFLVSFSENMILGAPVPDSQFVVSAARYLAPPVVDLANSVRTFSAWQEPNITLVDCAVGSGTKEFPSGSPFNQLLNDVFAREACARILGTGITELETISALPDRRCVILSSREHSPATPSTHEDQCEKSLLLKPCALSSLVTRADLERYSMNSSHGLQKKRVTHPSVLFYILNSLPTPLRSVKISVTKQDAERHCSEAPVVLTPTEEDSCAKECVEPDFSDLFEEAIPVQKSEFEHACDRLGYPTELVTSNGLESKIESQDAEEFVPVSYNSFFLSFGRVYTPNRIRWFWPRACPPDADEATRTDAIPSPYQWCAVCSVFTRSMTGHVAGARHQQNLRRCVAHSLPLGTLEKLLYCTETTRNGEIFPDRFSVVSGLRLSSRCDGQSLVNGAHPVVGVSSPLMRQGAGDFCYSPMMDVFDPHVSLRDAFLLLAVFAAAPLTCGAPTTIPSAVLPTHDRLYMLFNKDHSVIYGYMLKGVLTVIFPTPLTHDVHVLIKLLEKVRRNIADSKEHASLGTRDKSTDLTMREEVSLFEKSATLLQSILNYVGAHRASHVQASDASQILSNNNSDEDLHWCAANSCGCAEQHSEVEYKNNTRFNSLRNRAGVHTRNVMEGITAFDNLLLLTMSEYAATSRFFVSAVHLLFRFVNIVAAFLKSSEGSAKGASLHRVAYPGSYSELEDGARDAASAVQAYIVVRGLASFLDLVEIAGCYWFDAGSSGRRVIIPRRLPSRLPSPVFIDSMKDGVFF